MKEKGKKGQKETKKKGVSSWLKNKLKGEDNLSGPVDTKFLADLSDIETVGRYEIIEKLEWVYDNRTIDQGWLGEHECEICNNYTDRGEILIIDDDKMYVVPKMILHYIKDHFYRPPEDFINAVDNISDWT